MLGGLLTASVQIGLDLRPTGTLSLAAAPAQFESTPEAPPSGSDPGLPAEVHASTSSPAAAPSPARLSLPKDTLAVITWALVALILGFSYVARRLILVGRLGDRLAVAEEPLAGMLSELAHIARRDPIWLVVASLIERVLWFQPLNRVANRRIATAAEFICDDWAVRRTGSGVPLARCLAKVAEWIQASPLGVPVAGMAESVHCSSRAWRGCSRGRARRRRRGADSRSPWPQYSS